MIGEYIGYIYKTTNSVNGKFYIGQRSYKNDKKHYREMYLGSGKLLKLAINKNGRHKFYKEIIDKAYTKVELNEKEIYWIKFYDATNPKIGYNLDKGGGSMSYIRRGVPMSDEVKKKLSIVNTGKRHSSETKRKISEIQKGKKRGNYSDEHRKNISISRKGKPLSDQHRENLRKSHIGKVNKQNLRPIIQIDLSTLSFIETFDSVKESWVKVPKSKGNYMVANRKSGTAGGFIWRYVKDLTEEELNNKRLLA